MRVETLTLEEWGDLLPDAGIEVFHLPEALAVLARHAPGDLRLFGGFKGEQAVGLLPVFVRRRPYATVVTSPPPGMFVPRLGPVVMPTSPKRRKREKENGEFVRLALERLEERAAVDPLDWVGVDSPHVEDALDHLDVTPPGIYRLVCNAGYADPRPFAWEGFGVEPNFTYRIEVGDREPEGILRSFSRGLRREIRDGEDFDIEVTREGLDGVGRIYRATRARYDEQDESFPHGWDYVSDLAEGLGDRCRAYVARDADGEFLTGITALYANDVAYFWQGGNRATHEGVSVNSLLHWEIIEDIAGDPELADVTAYDLHGANIERLCRYKAKFNAELVPYYVIEGGGVGLELAKRAYRLLE